ncbi:unnamed protein product [Haemonchus placei]|uniref:Secreted protein n=1 Tax=Haemonchus placei TaxID=6290 RepID=A0A0N4WUY8_HAEPC|nr:unnamed protein product [Haemonchus placei]
MRTLLVALRYCYLENKLLQLFGHLSTVQHLRPRNIQGRPLHIIHKSMQTLTFLAMPTRTKTHQISYNKKTYGPVIKPR